MYKNFIDSLKEQMDSGLPGPEFQFEMAPFERTERVLEFMKNKSPKLSAVMIAFYPVESKPHFGLMLRNEYNGPHSAQVSLPGGKMDEEDDDLWQCAQREYTEEFGVNLPLKSIGQLTEILIPPSGFLVTPFVSFHTEKPDFNPDVSEVAELIEFSAFDLLRPEIVKNQKVRLSTTNQFIKAPFFDISGHVVWGATAMILGELKELIRRSV